MKEWNKPELWSLNAQSTEQGGSGGSADGGWIEDSFGNILLTTSGKKPSGPYKPVNPGTHA